MLPKVRDSSNIKTIAFSSVLLDILLFDFQNLILSRLVFGLGQQTAVDE